MFTVLLFVASLSVVAIFVIGLDELAERLVFGEFRSESPELERVLEEAKIDLIDDGLLSIHYAEKTPIAYIDERSKSVIRLLGLRQDTYSVKVHGEDEDYNFRIDPNSELYRKVKMKHESLKASSSSPSQTYLKRLDNV
jgi:hypothetical protein